MKELLISWKPTSVIPDGDSVIRRIYRWGSYIGILWNKEWIVEQRSLIQETPCMEECSPIVRAAPPATVDDAWEESYIDHGDYQSVEGSLLQIRMTSKNYKKQIMTAIGLGCPIDSSTIRMCEMIFQPMVKPEAPVPPSVPQQLPLILPLVPRVLSQEGRRQEDRRQEGRRQEGRRQEGRRQDGRRQDGLAREMDSVRSRPNGGAPRGQLGVAPVRRTLSVTPSSWLGTEE